MIEATLTNLLKSLAAKVFPLLAPANASAPFVVYTRVSTIRELDLDGPDGLAYSLFQVDVYASTYHETKTLANGIRASLDGFSDASIQYIRAVQERDLTDFAIEPRLYRTNMEFRITHQDI